MKTIELIDVSRWRGQGRQAVQALRGASLSLGPAELVLLEGPSGAGKTTLLSVAGGLLGVERGQVYLAGQPLHGASRAARRRLCAGRVGFVFQRPGLMGRLTVQQNLMLQAHLCGVTVAEAERRAAGLLERLGIAHLARRRPAELSGGEEQRAAVARALVHGPAVVLADEPTGNLDREAGQRVAGELAGLARSQGVAVLVATHDQRLRSHCTRRLWMEDGHVLSIREDPPGE